MPTLPPSLTRAAAVLVMVVTFAVVSRPVGAHEFRGADRSPAPPVDAPAATWSNLFTTGGDAASGTVVRRVEREGPDVGWFFVDDEPVRYEPPAADPDLFVSEPQYGALDADLVYFASRVLDRPVPWELDEDAGLELLDVTTDALELALSLRGIDPAAGPADEDQVRRIIAELDPEHEAGDSLWDVPPSRLAAATEAQLATALAVYGQAGGDPATLEQRVRAALHAARLPDRISPPQLARLRARATTDRMATHWQGPGTLDVSAPQSLGALVELRRLHYRSADGPVRAYLVTVPLDDQETRPAVKLASGWEHRATVADAARHHGLDVAVNGGFWRDDADPDGLLIDNGRLLSDPAAGRLRVGGVRSAVTIHPDRSATVDRPTLTFFVHTAAGTVPVYGVNRAVRGNDAVLFTAEGPPPTIPAGARVWAVQGVSAADLRVAGRYELDAVPGGPTSRPWGEQSLLVATGRPADVLAAPPQSLDVNDHNASGVGEWAISGGPTLLTQGRLTSVGEWRSEGFAPTHTDVRHPRTAIGFDAYGSLMLLVVDGRQPDWSVGATHVETARLLEAAGATDATNLDGGGSSQLVVDGTLVNRVCCDPAVRPVATVFGLQVGRAQP